MDHLDEELKRALTQDPPASVLPKTPALPQRPARRSWGLLVGLVTMGVAILAIVFTGIDNAAVYSKGVDQLLQEKERFLDRNVRVVGMLVRGSLQRRNEPCEYRFQMRKGESSLNVQFPQCIIPDTFRDVPNVDVEVTAEGKLHKDGTFVARQIMAKCPSKYDMKQRKQSGQDAPHTFGAPAAQSAY
ncbi:MAG TPA: cytochrome c maturation protein CcmE [Polyangiaceae bacterium]